MKIENDFEERSYIFKSIDKPFYDVEDTKILEQELQNLKMFHHCRIIQLISIVVSDNPYHISLAEALCSVLRRFLLEYHSGGTLEDALKNHRVRCGLRKWSIQIARGLEELHRLKIAHMDLKPSNVVFNAKDDAILIDISGIAFTNDWLAPEVREASDTVFLSWEVRCRNDIWAFGKVLSLLIQFENDSNKAELLHDVIQETTKGNPDERVQLCHVIRKLE